MNTLRFNATRIVTSLLIAGMALAVMAPASFASDKMSALDFQNAMRKLWEDHITWTRLYIVSAAAGLPDQDQTAQRLLQNQTDIGNAIKPFYGEQAGDQLTALLRTTSWALPTCWPRPNRVTRPRCRPPAPNGMPMRTTSPRS